MELKTMHLDAVTGIILYRVFPESKGQFSKKLVTLTNQLRQFEGYLGSKVVCRIVPKITEFLLSVTFTSEDKLHKWEKSQEIAEFELEIVKFLVENPTANTLPGSEVWYTIDTSKPVVTPAPKYKSTFITWLGIFPLVLLVSEIGGQNLAKMPLVLKSFVLTITVVPMMTYIAMPWLLKLFGGWMHRGAAKQLPFPAPEVRSLFETRGMYSHNTYDSSSSL